MYTLLAPYIATLPTSALNFDSIKALGWANLLWVVFMLFIGLMFKTGKIGFETIRRGERGLRELFGVPAWPVYHGAHFFIKGVLGVSKASIIPTDIALKTRAQLRDKTVIEVEARVRVQIRKDRRSLKKAIYSFEDEDRTDLENAARSRTTKSLLHDGIRRVLTDAEGVSVLTEESLRAHCAEELDDKMASTLERLYIEHLTPVDAQILADGKTHKKNAHSATILDLVPGSTA